MTVLREFNYKRIYGSPVILEQKRRFDRIVRELFEGYLKDLEAGNERDDIFVHFLANMNRVYATETSHHRIVADFIAGMTDRFLMDQYMKRFMPESIGLYL